MKDDDLLHLLDAATDHADRFGDGRRGNDVIRTLPDTSFENISKCHDWRNYVHPAIRQCWTNLGIDAMVSVYLITSQLAEDEVWE